MIYESDLPVHNDFASVPIVLDMKRDFNGTDQQVFEELMKRIRNETRSAKFQCRALGWNWLMGSYFFALIKPVLAWKPNKIMAEFTAVFSNVPGPLTPYVLNPPGGQSHKVSSLYYFVPGAARMGFSISAITHAGKLRVGALCDTSYFQQKVEGSRDFIQAYETNFNRCL